MPFVTIETRTIDGDLLLHQRDNPDGGHRIVLNGVNGDAVAFARIAVNGVYRATVVEGRDFAALTLPSLFRAQIVTAGGGLPELDVTITVGGAPDGAGGGRSLSFCDGVLSRGWGTINAAGGGTTDDAFDIGGGPDAGVLAAALKTQLDASGLDVTVTDQGGGVVLVEPGATGLLVSTRDPGAFALT